MAYEFPNIEHIDHVLPYVKDREDFISGPTGHGFTLVDYRTIVSNTFKSDDPYEASILRECRGLLFHADGTIARRAFHKFFNLNETPETHVDRLNSIAPHAIMEKLDGSMIAPFVWPQSGEIYWASMRGSIDYHAKMAALYNGSAAEALVRAAAAENLTAIFEYCAPDNRIVVDYREPKLVLTALRHLTTGQYHSHDDVQAWSATYNVPAIGLMETDAATLEDLITYVWGISDAEGAVVRFEDGTLTKLKGEWYVQLHKTLSYFDYEKDIAWLILNGKEDDLLGILTPERRALVEAYRDKLRPQLLALSNDAVKWRDRIVAEGIDRKTFAMHSEKPAHAVQHIIFRHFDKLHDVDPLPALTQAAITCTNRDAKWQTFKHANNIHLTWDISKTSE